MGLTQEDGFFGHGTGMGVTKNGHGTVVSISSSHDFHINEDSGKVWSIPFDALNPTANDDYVVYIKNTGDTNLTITDFRFSASAATRVNIHAVSGTAASGTDISPISRTVQSSAIPTATIQSGTDITGLANEGVLFFVECPVASTLYHLSTSSNIILEKGKAIAVSVVTGTANLSGIISIVEKALDN